MFELSQMKTAQRMFEANWYKDWFPSEKLSEEVSFARLLQENYTKKKIHQLKFTLSTRYFVTQK